MHALLGFLIHGIVPSGPPVAAVLGFLAIAASVGIAFAAWAIRVRREDGVDELIGLVRWALAILAVAIGVGSVAFGGGATAFLVLWGPAAGGLVAAAVVIHRRAARRTLEVARPRSKSFMAIVAPRPVGPENIVSEIAVASAAFVGAALAVISIPFVVISIAFTMI